MPKIKIEGRRTKNNVVTWLDINVLKAAKRRIRHIIAVHDSLAVAFSGGKDSLTVLHLVKEVYEELGLGEPVNVLFRDEEVIPDCVVDFVDEYRQKPWVKLNWFAVPLKSSKYVLGRTYDYVQWDPNREHVRQPPPWAIRNDSGRVFDQYSMDEYAASFYRGKVCILTGIRTSESLYRYHAIIAKPNDPEIAGTESPRVTLGRPIYDWSEDDIFRYFYDRGIRYCSIYDSQCFNGEGLRVSTPLHAEAAKQYLTRLRTRDPEFLDRILRVFPEVAVQERYFGDYDLKAVENRYPKTWDGVRAFIDDQIDDPKQRKVAHTKLKQVLGMLAVNPSAYTPEQVLHAFAIGSYKRFILVQTQRQARPK